GEALRIAPLEDAAATVLLERDRRNPDAHRRSPPPYLAGQPSRAHQASSLPHRLSSSTPHSPGLGGRRPPLRWPSGEARSGGEPSRALGAELLHGSRVVRHHRLGGEGVAPPPIDPLMNEHRRPSVPEGSPPGARSWWRAASST